MSKPESRENRTPATANWRTRPLGIELSMSMWNAMSFIFKAAYRTLRPCTRRLGLDNGCTSGSRLTTPPYIFPQ